MNIKINETINKMLALRNISKIREFTAFTEEKRLKCHQLIRAFKKKCPVLKRVGLSMRKNYNKSAKTIVDFCFIIWYQDDVRPSKNQVDDLLKNVTEFKIALKDFFAQDELDRKPDGKPEVTDNKKQNKINQLLVKNKEFFTSSLIFITKEYTTNVINRLLFLYGFSGLWRFIERDLVRLVLEHSISQKFILLTEEEADQMLKRRKSKMWQLPQILIDSDMICKLYGWPLRSVIKTVRLWPNRQPEPVYRVVVPSINYCEYKVCAKQLFTIVTILKHWLLHFGIKK